MNCPGWFREDCREVWFQMASCGCQLVVSYFFYGDRVPENSIHVLRSCVWPHLQWLFSGLAIGNGMLLVGKNFLICFGCYLLSRHCNFVRPTSVSLIALRRIGSLSSSSTTPDNVVGVSTSSSNTMVGLEIRISRDIQDDGAYLLKCKGKCLSDKITLGLVIKEKQWMLRASCCSFI